MSINGIIIVDKSADWTSHDVVAKLRGVFKVKRVGHGGTLDPMATGVLPVFIGCATRAAEFSGNAEKEYIAGIRFGLVTDTQDTTGNRLSSCESDISAEELSAILPRFLGIQKQVPPMYSAIKQGGKKLYELARQGIDVPRPARDINISAIELLEGSGSDFLLRVVCSKGAYIRTLCHDIGAAAGVGAAMSSLRRTRAGSFTIEAAHDLDSIQAAVASGEIEKIVLPVDSMFSAYPSVRLDDTQAKKIRNGAPCRWQNIPDGNHRFYGPDDEFLALGCVVGGNISVVKSFYEARQG